MLQIIHLGPLAIQFPGLILLIGLWIGLEMVERQAVRFNVPGGKLYTLTLVALAAGLIGARFVYAAQYPDFFENPLNLFALSPQLLNLPGGIVAGLIACLAYGQRSRLPLWSTLDALSGLFAVLIIAANLANFASGEAYGAPTDLPWAVTLWGVSRHPNQIYAASLAAVGLILIWPTEKSKISAWMRNWDGARFWVLLSFTALSHLFLEYFRGDSPLVFGGYRLVQLIAWLVLVLGLWNLNRLINKSKPTSIENGTL